MRKPKTEFMSSTVNLTCLNPSYAAGFTHLRSAKHLDTCVRHKPPQNLDARGGPIWRPSSIERSARCEEPLVNRN